MTGTLGATAITAGAFPSGQFSFYAVYQVQSNLTNQTGSITLDLSTYNNFYLTLSGNITLVNPSNLVAGQSGIIIIQQSGSGNNTLTLGTYWKFPLGTSKLLSTGTSAVDAITYYVVNTSFILCQLLNTFQ